MPRSPMESRMARLEGAYDQVSQRLMTIDPRFDGFDRKLDLRFDALDKKFDALEAKVDQRIDALEAKVDHRIDALEKKIAASDAKNDQHFMWLAGAVFTGWLTSIGATVGAVYLHH